MRRTGQFTGRHRSRVFVAHILLDDRESVHDRLGRYSTLLRFGDQTELPRLDEQRNGLPLETVCISDPEAAKVYDVGYLLVRPDQHIGWRGNEIPSDFDQILRKASGW